MNTNSQFESWFATTQLSAIDRAGALAAWEYLSGDLKKHLDKVSLLNELAEWFDNPNKSQLVMIPSGGTPGMRLREIAGELQKTISSTTYQERWREVVKD